LSGYQKTVLNSHCSDGDDFVLRSAKATETHTFYTSQGERLTSFSVSLADCSATDRKAESLVKEWAQELQTELEKKDDQVWNVSVQSEGRALIYTYRFKKPLTDEAFHRANDIMQKQLLGDYCSQKYWNGRDLSVKETHTSLQFRGFAPDELLNWTGRLP